MTRTAVLAIGDYPEMDSAPMWQDYAARFVPDSAEIAGLERDCRAGIRAVAFMGHSPFGADEMSKLANLGLISNYGVGYDAIDIAAASERGIWVTNTPDVLSDDVADLAIAIWLAQSRRLVDAESWLRAGNWRNGEYPLARKASSGRAGVLGLGRIGREIADRLAAFKMDIHYVSRMPRDTPGWTYHDNPVSLARAVDILFIALVGGTETRGLVSADVISALGGKGVLINISRGSTVDEAALLDALEEGEIAGAALDVFRSEPDVDARFLALKNVVLQPHLGSATVETRGEMGRLQRRNIDAFLRGEPLLTPVNKTMARRRA